MNKKRRLVAIILAMLLLGSLSMLLPSVLAQPFSGSLKPQSKEIISTLEYVPKISAGKADFYYEDTACKNEFTDALNAFQGIISEGTVKKISLSGAQRRLRSVAGAKDTLSSMPLLILEGAPPIIIAGESACSAESIVNLLCRYLPNASSCTGKSSSGIKMQQSSEMLLSNPCRESCPIEHLSSYSSAIIIEDIKSSLCAPILTYDEESSVILSRQCLDQKSCTSDDSDKACCKANECPFNGNCYPINSAIDLEGDGQMEICANVETSPYPKWANPDIAKEVCAALFQWVSPQSLGLKKIYGKTEYTKGDLCCGDDNTEQYVSCNGHFCKPADATCCRPGECSFNGACFTNGCHSLKSANGIIASYCNEGQWEDLDFNHCEECLGKSRSSSFICCGDDPKEGPYPTPFFVRTPKTKYALDYAACTTDNDFCVFPNSNKEFQEGCYNFNSNPYIEGSHYCHNAQWYDLDASKKYCKKCGFTFTTECCGDDSKEFLVTGSDGSLGCCKRPSDEVLNGVCLSTLNCGNGKLDKLEQCDPPTTDNNGFCSQSTIKCKDNKLGYRDPTGYCDDSCLCIEDNYTYSCTKGSCGATCSNDKECPQDYHCDQSTCGCVKRTFCGDGIISAKNDEGWKEECELPNTQLNPACNLTQKCFGLRTGLQYQYGSCRNDCLCSYLPYQRLCIKGSCGSECNQDGSGCPSGQTCDSNSCECIDADTSCGDGKCGINELYACPTDCISDPCPFRIDISLDDTFYRVNESVHMQVHLYDSSNRPIPNAPFEIDLLINQKYVDTSKFYTPSDGNYERSFKIHSSLPSGNYQYVAYIAKSRNPDCDTVGDSTQAFVFVDENGRLTNSSPYSLAYGLENITLADCGNSKIDPGEACEGESLCRISSGCNLDRRTYDIPEACIFCGCPRDLTSSPDDGVYCANCLSCGDGKVNCKEDCESGIAERGLRCSGNELFVQRDGCSNCTFLDDGLLNDEWVDDCMCKCPANPTTQCRSGDYVAYPSSYSAGCSGTSCNLCNCEDQYLKDTNKDGIEDKCSKEMCVNGYDDDDDGKIDMQDEDCSLCQYCGYGLFNGCDRRECSTFQQGCFFTASLAAYGKCSACSPEATCESYGQDQATCSLNPCKEDNCVWKISGCCTDSDNDGLCDFQDNCPNEKNEWQEDSDGDGTGNVCDLCLNEPSLISPTEEVESTCEDSVDNDCDGAPDCLDEDCIGKSGCCQSTIDCEDKECAVENCLNNKCISLRRSSCDATDCPFGEYCTSEGECAFAEASMEICTICVTDATSGDEGIGFSKSYSYGGQCCGNSAGEYYSLDEFGIGECCSKKNSCVVNGACVLEGKMVNSSLLCMGSKLHSCSQGSSCTSPDGVHTCAFDGSWAWRIVVPTEICHDGMDNDCDSFVDMLDTECATNASSMAANALSGKGVL